MNVVSFYFPLWLTQEKGLPEWAYSLVYSGAILTVSLLSPFLGFLSDLKKSRTFPLILSTLICILFTAFLGEVDSAKMALVFFFVAHAGYVTSLIFYNSMLPDVSAQSTPGRVCGWGVGLGYVGTIFGLWVASFFDAAGRQAVFLPTALMFLLFAFPLFFLFPKKTDSLKWVKPQFSQLKNHSKPIKWFFLANFLSGDAVHTVILYMAIYANKVFGMSDSQIRLFFILSTFFAIAASFVWGELTSKLGGLRTMKQALVVWLLVFILGTIAHQEWLYWVVGAGVGVGLAGIWISARVLVVELVPKERIGEYYGFYNLTGKGAAIFGPLWWGGLLLLFSELGVVKYRITLLSLALFIVGAFWALKKVTPTWNK